MAKQMNYTDAAGNNYTASYWRVVLYSFSPADLTGRIVFYGYASKDARDQNKAPVGVKEYAVTQAQYAQYFAPTIATGATNSVQQCYDFADATKDVLVSPEVPAVLDANGVVVTPAVAAVYAGYFDTATDC